MSEYDKKITLLKEVNFFPPLSDEDYKPIVEKCKIVKFPPNTVIFSQDDEGDNFYIIESGKVKITRKTKGEEKTLAILTRGEFFGEMALLSGEKRSASAISIEDTTCITLSKADFNDILEKNPSIALNLSKTISRRLLQSGMEEKEDEKGTAISVYGVKDRIGRSTLALNLSLYLADSLRKKVVLVDLDLQYGDIAFMLGIKPERTISGLASKKSYDIDLINEHLLSDPSGIKVLSSPFKIEESEKVSDKDILSIITQLKENYDFVIIDTSSYLTPNIISALDCSNYILFLVVPDILTLKSSKNCLDLMKNLEYSDDKIKIILNFASGNMDLSQSRIEELLSKKIEITIPFDHSVHQAILKGIPLLKLKPNSPASQSISTCANLFVKDEKKMKSSSKFLSGLFKLGRK